jgi:bifunctional non-homologous end joining protein LigD
VKKRAGRRTIDITHPDKVLFPKDGVTKADLVDHYLRVADLMLPHVRDRPMSQHRWPDGIGGQSFWHKQAPGYFPDWIPRVEVRTEKGPQQQVLCNEQATLAYLANQNCITPHVWTARADDLRHPDQVIFDLDPPGDDFRPVREGALLLKEMLEEIGLVPFVKTTGSKGLHVVAPLDRTGNYEEARAFSHRFAVAVVSRDRRLTTEVRKNKRRGRIFVDTGRNAYGQTAVPPYAVRALDGAPVATPVTWEEVRKPHLTPRRYTIETLPRRLSETGDPWKGMGRRRRSLHRAAALLATLGGEPGAG